MGSCGTFFRPGSFLLQGSVMCVMTLTTTHDQSDSKLLESGSHFTVRTRRLLSPYQSAVCARVYAYMNKHTSAHMHTHLPPFH